MAAGDTIAGQLRYIRETQSGHAFKVAGPFSSLELDQANLENRLFINVTPGVDAPQAGANMAKAPSARWAPGEVLKVQHLSNSLAEAIKYDADEIEIKGLERDLNTGEVSPRTLTVKDTTVSANPTSSTTVWTTIFAYTIADRTEFGLKGPQKAAATENA